MLESSHSSTRDTSTCRAYLMRCLRPALIVLGYLALYLALSRIIAFQASSGISPWNPLPGLSLALVLIFGPQYAPTLFFAQLLDTWLIASQLPLTVRLVAVVAEPLGYALAAIVLRRVLRIDSQLQRLRDVSWFVLVGLIAPAVVTMSVVASLVAEGVTLWSDYLPVVSASWIGDAIGVMTLTPFLLVNVVPWANALMSGEATRPASTSQAARHQVLSRATLGILAEVIGTTLVVLGAFGLPRAGELHLYYLCFLPLIWIALRHGLPGTTVGVFGINVGAIATVLLLGFELSSLVELQLLMLGLSIVGSFLGVVTTERRRTEKALRQSEQKFRGIVEQSVDGIMLADERGTITEWNQTMEAITGLKRAEVLGQAAWDIQIQLTPEEHRTQENREFIERSLREFLGTGKAPWLEQPQEVVIRRPDGEIRNVQQMYFLVASDEGFAICSTVRDVTESKQLESIEQEQRLLAEALRDTAAALTGTLDLSEVLDRILANVGRVVQHDAANIMLVESGVAWVVGYWGYPERGLEKAIQAVRFLISDTPSLRQMARTGQPLIVPDVRNYPGWVDVSNLRWIRSYAGAPIQLGGKVIGFVNLDSARPDFFSQIHAERLQAFATQAAIAIHNARLYEQTQYHAAQLETLRRVTLDITAQLDLTSLLNALVRSAVELLGASSGGIYLYRPEEDVIEWVVSVGQEGLETIGSVLKRGEGLSGKVWELDELLIVDNYSQWEGRAAVFEGYPFSAVMGVPIRWGEEFLGVLNVLSDTPQRTFSKNDAYLLGLFATQAAIAIHNARLYRGLEAYSKALEQAVEVRTAALDTARERAETILASVGDLVVVTDLDGHILVVNPSFEQQTGYTADEVLGLNARSLLNDRMPPEALADIQAALMQGEVWSGELVGRRKDHSLYDIQVTIAPVRDQDGHVVGQVSCGRDITEQKEVERLKDTFVANVSHELRTPLTSLKLYHHLLRANPDKRDIYMEHLDRETERLERIVEDLLHLSQMGQEQITLNLAPMDVNAVVAQYVADRTPLSERRGLALSFAREPDLPMVEADADLLGQVLSTLLANALNYTPAGGQVTIGTTTRQVGKKCWVGISVSDTGPGIPSHELPHLFERFFRGRAGRESGVPGTGLGLAVAKEIVDRHEGQIEVTSTGVPGEGTTFVLWLPVAKPK